jgi:hypothetical protein
MIHSKYFLDGLQLKTSWTTTVGLQLLVQLQIQEVGQSIQKFLIAEKIMEAWYIDIFFNDFRRWGSIPNLKLETSAMPRASAP